MALYRGKNFSPTANYTVAATTTSQNQVITQPANGERNNDLLISNSTSSVAFLAWGPSAATATAAGFAVLPGETIAIDITGNTTNVAVILAAGTGNVYLSTGCGT